MRHGDRRSVKDINVRLVFGFHEHINDHWWRYRYHRCDRWDNNDRWHWANHSQR
jgi:hypothetical protein